MCTNIDGVIPFSHIICTADWYTCSLLLGCQHSSYKRRHNCVIYTTYYYYCCYYFCMFSLLITITSIGSPNKLIHELEVLLEWRHCKGCVYAVARHIIICLELATTHNNKFNHQFQLRIHIKRFWYWRSIVHAEKYVYLSEESFSITFQKPTKILVQFTSIRFQWESTNAFNQPTNVKLQFRIIPDAHRRQSLTVSPNYSQISWNKLKWYAHGIHQFISHRCGWYLLRKPSECKHVAILIISLSHIQADVA